MIGEPFNDTECLSAITSVIASMAEARDPALLEIATAHPTTASLASWIRTLPQRDDDGATDDGPKVRACQPRQRLRIPAADPNCVERAALYVAVAELIDPAPVRRLRTESTPIGLHTFPLENDEPVTLDPRVTRNALRGALYVCQVADQDDGGPIRVPMTEAIDWIATLAHERIADTDGGGPMVERSRLAMRAALEGARLPPAAIREIAATLAIAEREARAFGPDGVAVVHKTADAMIQRTAPRSPRNFGIRVGGYTLRPDWRRVAKLGQATGRIGERAGWLALRAYLGNLGIGGAMLGEVERELGKSGLTLGRLATEPPPMPGTLAAYADAAARR